MLSLLAHPITELPGRISRKGLRSKGKAVSFIFDGRHVQGLHGETIAAALTAAGITGLRDDQAGGKRGLYCGMGACFECVVTIDGQAGQRACLRSLRGGEVIHSAMPMGTVDDPLKPLTPAPLGEHTPERLCDVLVVGAGPAGLSAARAAASAGAHVILLDERPQAGGQYYKPVAKSHAVVDMPDRQWARGAELLADVEASGVEIINEAQVFGAFAADDIMTLIDGRAVLFKPKRLILATGAFEVPVPIPGWTLPGVMTTGAMQTLARSYQVKPGARVAIAGNGPLNMQLAADLVAHGVEVVALAEAAGRPQLSSALFKALRADPALMATGAGYLARLVRHRVPIFWGHRAVAIEDHGDVRLLSIKGAKGEVRQVEADAVALGYGFASACEIASALGCELEFDERYLGSWRVTADAQGRTSLPAVFAVGDGANVAGAPIAQARGAACGRAAATDLGFECQDRPAISLERHTRFQAALWQLFRAQPVQFDEVPDPTILCRCESLDFAAVRAEIAKGARSLGVLKRRLRLGMGRCQGRYCSMTASKLLSEAWGTAPATFAPRLPVKPFPASSLLREKPEWGGHARAGSPNLARPQAAEPFEPVTTEIVIIGGGVVGACLAHEFGQLGHQTLVLERDDVNLQASGANAGSLHVQLLSFDFGAKAEAGGGPAAATLPLGPWAIRLWQDLARACDHNFEIRITGGLMVADSEAGLRFLDAKAALERRHGLEAELLDAGDLQRMAPNLSPDLMGAEWSSQEGKINPLTATLAVMDRACGLGVGLKRSCDVLAIEPCDHGWRIETSRGVVRAAKVINAAGPWAQTIGAMVGLAVPVHSAPLQMIVTERAPPLVDQLIAHADRHLSMKQLASGGLVIGGAWTARYSEAQNLNVTLRDSIEGNLWVGARVLPQLAGLHVLRSWAGMNVNIDGAPIVGEAPGLPGFYNCVTSNGYTLAPAVARLTAELLRGQAPSFDTKPYALERFG